MDDERRGVRRSIRIVALFRSGVVIFLYCYVCLFFFIIIFLYLFGPGVVGRPQGLKRELLFQVLHEARIVFPPAAD